MPKNENILDQVDKDLGPRTCPECGYQFPLSLFVRRYVMKFGFPKWTCPNCHELIKYNYTRSNLIGVAIFLVCIFSFLGLQAKFGWDLPIFSFMIPYFILTLVLLNFDTLQKYK